MDCLKSKVAVITGAASGIGLAIAREFGRQGMRVVLSDVSEERLNNAVTLVASEGTRVHRRNRRRTQRGGRRGLGPGCRRRLRASTCDLQQRRRRGVRASMGAFRARL